MKRKKAQDSASIILRSFLLVVTIIIVSFSLITVASIGHQLLKNARTSTEKVIDSLRETEIDDDDDWENWRYNSTLDTSTSYVKIYNTRKDATRKFYYSPRTKKLLKTHPKKVPFFKHVYYSSKYGFVLFYITHARGIRYELWTKMSSQVEILQSVIIVTIIVLLLVLIISPLYIRILADRLTRPLSDLTTATQTISKTTNESMQTLPVPDKPTEVTELTNSFNRLLSKVYEQTTREKLFVSNAAHELRTPIATIQSHAQLIARRGKDHPEILDKSVGYINDESHLMSNLVEELLILSRADQNKIELAKLDLSQLVTETLDKLTPVIQQNVVSDIDANVFVSANQISIEQILINLVNNAAKYSNAATQIEVTLKQKDDQILLKVSDQGMGIKSADKQHVFDRFYRADDIRGSISGNGLGLAIVKQLADMNHLTITIVDNQPHGTIFTVGFKKI
ncbi:sensor histidine kinase [Paucilactobacillus sp. N302-9]